MFGAPNWVLQTLIDFALIAFPVALVLAWVFEVSPEGVRWLTLLAYNRQLG